MRRTVAGGLCAACGVEDDAAPYTEDMEGRGPVLCDTCTARAQVEEAYRLLPRQAAGIYGAATPGEALRLMRRTGHL